MTRLQEKEQLFFALGQLFGPVLRVIDAPDQFDTDERTRIIARFFHDGPAAKAQADQFFRGEMGHDYNSHRHHFWALMCKLDNRHVSEDQFLQLIPMVARETAACISSVPVTLDAAIHDARTPFSTYALVKDLCSTAQREIIWTDRYFDQSIFHRYFRDIANSVLVTLVTWPATKATGKKDQARVADFMDVSRLFAQERGPRGYRLVTNSDFHDRLIMADDKMFVLGGSIKDLPTSTTFTIGRLDTSSQNEQKFDEAINNGTEVFGPSTPKHP